MNNHSNDSKKKPAKGIYPEKFRSLPLFDGAFDAHKLAAEECDVLLASYNANSSVPPHRHETENHGVITRGELLLTINNEQQRYGVGDWYHVPANIEHHADFNVATDTIEFWFHQK